MKFLSDIEVQLGLKDSSGAIGSAGQVLSSTGSLTSWIDISTPSGTYLPLTAGSSFPLTGDLYITKNSPVLTITDTVASDLKLEIKQSGSTSNFISRGGTSSKGQFIFRITDGSTVTNALLINQQANVGIGTTSPGVKLDVNGSIRVSGRTVPTSGNGLEMFYYSPNDVFYIEAYDYTNTDWKSIRYSAASHQFTTGNVGIGTTSPKTSLDIVKDADIWHLMVGGATKKLLIGGQAASGDVVLQAGAASSVNNAAVTTVYNLCLQRDGGNVGIGTPSPQRKLHVQHSSISPSSVYGTLIVEESNESSIGILGTTYSSVYFGDAESPYTGGIIYQHSDNHLEFRTNDNSEKARITSGGELIINGTTSAYGVSQGYPLHVKGTSSQGYVSICRGTQNSGSEGLIVGTDSSNAYLLSRDNISLILGTNNLSHVFIKPNGNVGIGTTSPAAKLEVNGDTSLRADYKLYFGQSNTSLGTWTTRMYANASEHRFNANSFVFNNEGYGSTEYMRIDSAGNVGIGEDNPDSKLEVSGTFKSTGWSYLAFDGPTSIVHMGSENSTATQLNITTSATGSSTISATNELGVNVDNSTRIKILSNGKVGIGTTNPSQLLHVAGNMRLQNQLYDSTNSLGSNGEVLTKVSAGTEWKAPAVNAKMPDNTAPASPANVGTIRYRSTSNTSFVDMSMQTGATTYTWVNIVSNFW